MTRFRPIAVISVPGHGVQMNYKKEARWRDLPMDWLFARVTQVTLPGHLGVTMCGENDGERDARVP